MNYTIREMTQEEYALLGDFLYEAIYIPKGVKPPPRSVVSLPELQEYIVDFGTRKHDRALAAEVEGQIVGAVWVRIMNDYGHINDDTPSLAMSVYQEYRGVGIGTALLKALLSDLKSQGYPKVSLSVQNANYAAKMYQTAGFHVVGENEEEYIMVVDLCRS